MRAQLIQYVDLLFAGTKDCEDIHQEILQNTLDRYDDLIMEGKTPEAAYRLAILSIGDINEIIGGSASAPSAPAVPRTTADKKSAASANKKWIPIVIAVVIAVLLLNVIAELFEDRVWRGHSSPAASQAPVRIDETTGGLFYVKETTNVRSKPTSMGEVRGSVEAGTTVQLTRDEMVNGEHWGYITEPVQGWVCLGSNMEATEAESAEPTLAAVDPAVTESVIAEPAATDPTLAADSNATVPAADGNNVIAAGYGCNAADVSEINIQWAAGNIEIIPVDGSRINVRETGDFEKYPMVIKNQMGKLTISYSEAKKLIGIHSVISKDLTIELPRDLVLRELEIDAAAATVTVQDLSFREVEFKGASGKCDFINCNVDSLDVDTASGDINFTGSLKSLDCDAMEASFYGTLTNVPRQIEMDSMSGNLDITLPENAGFTVTMEGVSQDFTTDFPETVCTSSHYNHGNHHNCNGRVHSHGDGACQIQMEALSGEVIIRKG